MAHDIYILKEIRSHINSAYIELANLIKFQNLRQETLQFFLHAAFNFA